MRKGTLLMEKMSFEIYRYNPDVDAKPYMQRYELELEPTDVKLLDAWTL